MAEIKVYYDREASALTVWFDDPRHYDHREEIGDEVVLMKDQAGHVIGIERFHFVPGDAAPLRVAFETVSGPIR